MRQEGLAVPHRQHSARVQLVTGWVFGESLQSPELPPWNFHLCTFLGIVAPVNLSSIQCTDIVDYFKSFVNHGLLHCLLSDLPPSRSPYTFKETLSSPPLGACYTNTSFCGFMPLKAFWNSTALAPGSYLYLHSNPSYSIQTKSKPHIFLRPCPIINTCDGGVRF